MQDDDEIIGEYEQELGSAPSPVRRSNRSFWIVAVSMILGGVLLVVEIFANRPLVSSIGHAQSDLRAADALARGVRTQTGSFDGADAAALSRQDPSRSYVGPDSPSTELGQVSVFTSGTVWAAAVQVRSGACFYIAEQTGRSTRYGGGTLCTGRAAVTADAEAW